jgi:hypothetical protein
MLFDGDGNRMTPTHAINKGTRYRYYVSRPLITKGQIEQFAGLRVPAGEIEQLVTSRMRQWLVDPGSVYQATRLADPSMQRRLIARAAEMLLELLMAALHRQRILLPIPFALAEMQAGLLELLPNPPLTRDQVRLLKTDKVVRGAEPTLGDLGVQPRHLEQFLMSIRDSRVKR